MYKINDAFIHIKPRMTFSEQKKDKSKVWQFTFRPDELQKIKSNESNVVLVCADNNIKSTDKMWRILIEFKTLKTLIELDNPRSQDSLTAKYRPNARKLEITGNGNTVLIAPKALLVWEIPGG